MGRQSKKTLEEIRIKEMEALTQDSDRWKLTCVAVMGLKGLWKAEEEEN